MRSLVAPLLRSYLDVGYTADEALLLIRESRGLTTVMSLQGDNHNFNIAIRVRSRQKSDPEVHITVSMWCPPIEDGEWPLLAAILIKNRFRSDKDLFGHLEFDAQKMSFISVF